jgi:protein phosphatase
MKCYKFSNQGKRKVNQDFILINENPDLSIFLLADGMGGYQYGDVAAKIAIESINTFLSNSKIFEISNIQKAVNKANLAIRQFSQEKGEKIGCTLGGLIQFKNKIYCFWIGDVRIIHFRNRKIEFESKDHTLINQLKENGSFSDLSRLSKYRHIVTRSIQGDVKESQIGYYNTIVSSDSDIFIICTDGVHDIISSELIHKYLFNNSNGVSLCELEDRLLTEANDNNSLIALCL